MRGNVLMRRGDTGSAISSFDKALAAGTPCLQALEPFCTALFSRKRYDAAARRLDAMAARDPHNGTVRYWRGLAVMYQGEIGQAIVDFDFVLAGGPANADAYFNKALCLEALGRREAAAENYALAIRFGSMKSENVTIARQRLAELKAR
jgi:tetratricopeptide (TPR) repeat protein